SSVLRVSFWVTLGTSPRNETVSRLRISLRSRFLVSKMLAPNLTNWTLSDYISDHTMEIVEPSDQIGELVSGRARFVRTSIRLLALTFLGLVACVSPAHA